MRNDSRPGGRRSRAAAAKAPQQGSGKPHMPAPQDASPGKHRPAKPHGKTHGKPHAPALDTREARGLSPFRKPSSDLVALYGTHAVREALRAKRRELLDLYVSEAAAERLAGDILAAGLTPKIVDPRALDRRLGEDAVHQGVLLEARPLPLLDVADLERRSGIVLVLDQITDPHNVGAILRTAAAFDVDGVVMTERHSPELSGVLAKSASGALDLVPIAQVVNLARALDQLGDLGYWRIGLDSDGKADLAAMPISPPVALVLGAEGDGIRRLTRERCDAVARLDMPGAIKSLNVSNACAVALAYARRAASKT